MSIIKKMDDHVTESCPVEGKQVHIWESWVPWLSCALWLDRHMPRLIPLREVFSLASVFLLTLHVLSIALSGLPPESQVWCVFPYGLHSRGISSHLPAAMMPTLHSHPGNSICISQTSLCYFLTNKRFSWRFSWTNNWCLKVPQWYLDVTSNLFLYQGLLQRFYFFTFILHKVWNPLKFLGEHVF